ncbi:MAG: DUF4386 family protein [Thermoflexales bacterium]|nr:DUF4386 family protein [Thermoflexales bacterium]
MSHSDQVADSRWKNLYRVGGIAPLVALAFYLIEALAIGLGGTYPTTTESWYALLQRNKLLGLLDLNALDILSIALLGTLFLALYQLLKRYSESYMAIATFFAFLGIAVFVVPRVAMLSILLLSDQYAAAATEAQRTRILTAGDTLGSLGTATPQTAGFFFIAAAVLIISLVMLRSGAFGKATAYAGILAGVITVANDFSLVVAPSIAGLIMPISGVFWIVWWVLISRMLFKLSGNLPEKIVA